MSDDFVNRVWEFSIRSRPRYRSALLFRALPEKRPRAATVTGEALEESSATAPPETGANLIASRVKEIGTVEFSHSASVGNRLHRV